MLGLEGGDVDGDVHVTGYAHSNRQTFRDRIIWVAMHFTARASLQRQCHFEQYWHVHHFSASHFQQYWHGI